MEVQQPDRWGIVVLIGVLLALISLAVSDLAPGTRTSNSPCTPMRMTGVHVSPGACSTHRPPCLRPGDRT